MKLTTNHKEEVELLKRESEIPLEDLLKDLPPDYLEDRNRSLSPQNVTNEAEQNVHLFFCEMFKHIFLYNIYILQMVKNIEIIFEISVTVPIFKSY